MGEWSKSIGEKGEEIVSFFFEEILNFNSLVENKDINCVKNEKHKKKEAKKNRTKHGVDGLMYYKSPLEDNLLDIVIISSKYTSKEYSSSKKTIRTIFRDHIRDLSDALECFRFSEDKSKINKEFTEVNKTNLTGVLVWLSNKSPLNHDLSPFLNNIVIEKDLNFDKIILIDNQRLNFFYESIFRTKEKYDEVDFVYHNSGVNISSYQKESYGKRFPLNYLYSDIIPLRVVDGKDIVLIVFINDDFEAKNFIKILDFAQSFDLLKAIDKTILKFKTYDSLVDNDLVKERLLKFDNYKFDKNLIVEKFPPDYRK